MACNPEGQEDRRRIQFRKIQFLNSLSSYVIDIAFKNGMETLPDDTDLGCGALPEGDFEKVIDQTAAHQFLSLYMNIVESRLAFSVTKACKCNGAFLDAFKTLFKEAGKNVRTQVPENAIEAYNLMDSIILDGMPCDETRRMEEADENKVVWVKLMDTHRLSWQKCGGDVNVYYQLQKCLIEGLLEGSRVQFSSEDNVTFCLEVKQ